MKRLKEIMKPKTLVTPIFKTPTKPKEPALKPKNIKIITINTILVPSQMGAGYGIVTAGLGSDNRLYQWNAAKKDWQEG